MEIGLIKIGWDVAQKLYNSYNKDESPMYLALAYIFDALAEVYIQIGNDMQNNAQLNRSQYNKAIVYSVNAIGIIQKINLAEIVDIKGVMLAIEEIDNNNEHPNIEALTTELGETLITRAAMLEAWSYCLKAVTGEVSETMSSHNK